VDSGDDEEIESDAAFEESDEETYAGFDFSSKVCAVCLYKVTVTHPQIAH